MVCKSHQHSADSTAEELQTSSDINISTISVCQELKEMGFHGRQQHASLTSENTMVSVGWSGEKHGTTGLWSSGNLFCGVTNHTFCQSDGRVWVWRMPEERYLPDCTVPTINIGGGRIMVWGYFPGVVLGPLDSVKGNLNASVYQDILPDLDPQLVNLSELKELAAFSLHCLIYKTIWS